jgi:hypothetical protein
MLMLKINFLKIYILIHFQTYNILKNNLYCNVKHYFKGEFETWSRKLTQGPYDCKKMHQELRYQIRVRLRLKDQNATSIPYFCTEDRVWHTL